MKERAARPLAGPASLRADTAVLVRGGMAVTFRSADPTRLGAGHQLRLHQHRARACETCNDVSRGEACVRAVEAGSDAADEVSHVSLAQACVGTADAQATTLIAGCRARLDQGWVGGALRVS